MYNLDLGPGPRSTHGVDGLSTSTMARVTRNRDDALHLQGQSHTGLCRCYPDGERELALRVLTVGAACGTKGVSKWIVWCCGIFPSASDAVLHRSINCGSRVDGGVLRPTADEMASRERAGQVALGHLPIIVLLELPRVVRRVSGGLAARRARRHTYIAVNNDAVHGLRAAPEPDAALRETLEVSQFVALVEQDFFNLKLSSYQ